MSRNNYPFQVLVTSGDQDLLAKDQGIESLAVGQLGIFSYKDNISVDETSTDLATRGKNFYLAVGVDTNGGATLNDINKSAGTHIQARNLISYSGRCYTPAQEKIVEIEGFTAKSDTEYGIKIEVRNQQAYRVNGYNQVMKSFITKSPIDETCAECPDGDCIEVVKDLVADMNADADELFLAEFIGNVGSFTVTTEPTADGTATITLGTEAAVNVPLLDADLLADVATKIAAAINGVTDSAYVATANAAVVTIYGTTTGDVVFAAGTATSTAGTAVNVQKSVVADADVFKASGTSACLGIRITIQPEAVKTFCDINLNYFAPRQTDVIVTKIAGFENQGTITTTQDLAYEEGSGYDIKQLEYEAGGWNGRPGPYRVSELLGTARNGFKYFASESAKYNQVILGYDQASIAGFLKHENHLGTVIAIPVADSTTRDAVVAALDAIASNFEPLAAYVATCPTDGTTLAPSNASGENFADSIGTV